MRKTAQGDRQAASATARTLSAIGPGAPYPGALAAWVRGRLDHDETQLRRAADDLAELGFVYEAAVARLDLAELAASQVDAVGESLQVLERLGAQPQLDRARRLLRRLGQRPTASPRQRRAGRLSPREEQVARLVAAGLTNPEIAQRLYLSPRTVTTHLQNMYGRLELRSRAALTRYVLEELPPDTRVGRQNTLGQRMPGRLRKARGLQTPPPEVSTMTGEPNSSATVHSTAESVPLAVEPPKGFWVRETSHAPLPWTPFTQAVFQARSRGIRHSCGELGFLVETAEFRDIGGWEYTRIVPLGGKEPPPLPAWVTPLALRIVPSLRRRIRRSVAAVRSDVPGALIRRWTQEWQPDLAARAAALRGVDLADLDDTRLDEHLCDVLALCEHGQTVHFRLHGAIAMALAELAFTCRDLFGWEVAKVVGLLAGTSEMSTAPAHALAGLAAIARQRPVLRQLIEDGAGAETVCAADDRFAAAFDDYLQEYGCRVLRYEMAEPCLDEQPDLVIALIRDQLATGFDPDATEEALRTQRAAARAEALRLLANCSPPERNRFDRALDRALAAYPVREDNECFTTSIPFALARRAALEMGRRLAARGLLAHRDDAFWLKPVQLRAALRESLDCRALATRRAGERAWALAHPGPASYGTPPGPPPSLSALPAEARLANEAFLWAVEQNIGPHAVGRGVQAAETTEATVVSGIPVSGGSYTGPARIIRSESEFGRLRPGDVLVCPVTSPVWSVLFPSIGALVTDIGGMLSHPAIIAREYRLPAVVATGDGTSRLTDGQIVTVDGTAGTVRTVQ